MADQSRAQLAFPLDAQSKKTLDAYLADAIQTVIFDAFWVKLFHILTTFESINTTNSGFNSTAAGGAITADGTQITMTTGATSGNSAEVTKQPLQQNIITFSQQSNFRTGIFLSSVANATTYIIVGTLASGAYYGFKIVNATLSGCTFDGTTENLVTMGTILANTLYTLEARFQPGVSVTFWMGTPTRVVATSTKNLPPQYTGGAVVANTKLFDLKITTNANAAKTLNVSFLEYLQFKPQLN